MSRPDIQLLTDRAKQRARELERQLQEETRRGVPIGERAARVRELEEELARQRRVGAGVFREEK